MLYDPRRDALLGLRRPAYDAPVEVLHLATDDWRVLTTLPFPEAKETLSESGFAALDVERDTLVVGTDDSLRAFDMSSLGDGAIGCPVKAMETSERRFQAPEPGWLRAANQLIETDTPFISPVEPPAGYRLLAVLPAGPLLPLGEHQGIAIAKADDDDFWDADPGEVGSAAFWTGFIDEPIAGPAVAAHDGELRVATQFGFMEQDRLHWRQMNTLADNQEYRAHQTKVGGYARLLQGGEEEEVEADTGGLCTTCSAPMPFRAQLSSDLFEIGDTGRAYLYVCPSGCEAGLRAECC